MTSFLNISYLSFVFAVIDQGELNKESVFLVSSMHIIVQSVNCDLVISISFQLILFQ